MYIIIKHKYCHIMTVVSYIDADLVVLTNVLCLFSLPLPQMASKIKSTVSHCDSRTSNKAVCNREQGTHMPL
jgi:lipopolysaccharide biosynthesis glycosyltransferase